MAPGAPPAPQGGPATARLGSHAKPRAGLTGARLPLAEALALGALQGPTELLPVSSSGHLALVPRLLGWRYAELPPEQRKLFEVALHAGSAAALAGPLGAELLTLGGRDLALLGLTLAPPALAGYLLEGPVERQQGGERCVAVAQVGAGLALLWADLRPGRRGRADALDHFAVGLAQAVALVPGVSRAGAALTAARLRGLDRRAAVRLARRAALPVTVAAAVLKAGRALSGALPAELRAPTAFSIVAALASTRAALPLLARLERASSLAPLAAYRVALGLVALAAPTRPCA